MPSVLKTSISDPLRPRPLNTTTLPVTPVRLAAQFDDASDDVCLTELVARATEAAAFFNASNNPLPSDSDDDDVGPANPLKFLPAPLQSQPHGAPPMVAIPPSGSQALEYMKRTSVTATQKDYSYIIGVMLGLVPLSVSDPHLYRAHKGHIQSSEGLFIEWEKSAAHKNLVQRFVKEFRELSSQKLTKSMELFYEYLIEVKRASAQVAFTAMLYYYTVERRSYNLEPVSNKMRSREVQLIMWLVMYMETGDEDYIKTFRQDCISRSLDLTSIADCGLRASSTLYPGYNRLAMCEEDTMTLAWSWIMRDLCAYLGGALINNELDVTSLNEKYFVPENKDIPHDLRFRVLADGSFTDVLDWLTDELHARTAVNTVANQAGILSWIIDDYKTVGNMLNAMKTPESMDLYTAWWEQYRRSDQVPTSVVTPTGGWPIIEVSLCKALMRDAEKDLLANIPLQRERAAIFARRQQQQQARRPGETRPGKQQPPAPTPVGKKKCRICRKVPDDGHNTANCPNRSGNTCNKWMQGKCNRGADCVYEHPARDTPPATPAAPTPPPCKPAPAPPPYKPAPVPVPPPSALPAALENFTPLPETGMQEISCRNTTSPECTPHFMCDLAYWGKLVNDKAKEGIEYCLPKSCDKCRAYDRAHRSASMVTGQESTPTSEPAAPTAGESHENDGADDEYDYYHDYDVSMGSAVMVTSLAEVAQVDWWKDSVAMSAWDGDYPEACGVEFNTVPAEPKCSIQLSVAAYKTALLADDGEIPEIQTEVLEDAPIWMVAAHAEHTNLLLDDTASSLMLANNTSCPVNDCLVDGITSIDGEESSDDADTISQLSRTEAALPSDHARYTMRQFKKFNIPVSATLQEIAALEADNSMCFVSMEPESSKRASRLPDLDGYALLGDQIDSDITMDEETAAALMESPSGVETGIDLESSGSDHIVSDANARRLRKYYVQTMDRDARELVYLFPTAQSNSVGDLVMSSNVDEVDVTGDQHFH